MKWVIGWVVSAGMIAGAADAGAQALQPYRLGGSPYLAASDVGDPSIGGPYVARPYPTGPYAAGPYAAMPRYAPPSYYTPAVLAPQDIYAIVRESGFSPLGAPRQRGLVYTISVIDLHGEDGRLVIDARSGRVLRFLAAYRMGDRMGDAMTTSYGPAGPLPPMADPAQAPRPPLATPRVASRTPAVPLPRAAPPAVAAPKGKVEIEVKPRAAKPVPAPVQQSAVAPPKPAEAPAAAPAPAAPSVPAAIEARPTAPVQPTQPMPAAQGLE